MAGKIAFLKEQILVWGEGSPPPPPDPQPI